MPIYEYRCPECGHDFESLVRSAAATPACPGCGCASPEKKLSAFATLGDHGGAEAFPAACGSCGHPGGPGSCGFD